MNNVYIDKDLHLPVMYDGNFHYINCKDWRIFEKPYTNRSTSAILSDYICKRCWVQNSIAYADMSTSTASSNLMSFAAIATEGFGLCAEEHVDATHTWEDAGIIKAEHVYLDYIDNKTKKTEYANISSGIPLWHANSNGTCTLSLTVANVDTANKPKVYIAKKELEGSDATKFDMTSLYKLSLNSEDNKIMYDYILLNDGTNTITINNVKNDDCIYFKILHDYASDKSLTITKKPTMEIKIKG